MYLGSWKIDDLLTFCVQTQSFSTGAATDADSAPAYRVYEDETTTPILTGTMALLDSSNTDGFYSEQITLSAANGFEVGKSYNIRISATVGGVASALVRTLQILAAVNVSQVNSVSTSSVTTINANLGTTQPINFTGTAGSALTKSDMVDVAGAAVSTSTAQMGVNVVQINGQTASAAGTVTFPGTIASTTNITSATGIDVTKINGTSIAGTGTRVADAFTSFFNVTSPTGTVNSLPVAIPGASGGLVIAGSNAATTFSTFTCTNNFAIGGNLSVSNAFSIGGTLAAGTISVSGDITATGDFSVAGTTTLTLAANTITAASIAAGAIVTGTFAAGTTLPSVTLVDTVTTVTGLTVSNLDATISSRASATNLATANTSLVKIQAAIYDSTTLSGSTLTLSNGATMVVETTGRTTT